MRRKTLSACRRVSRHQTLKLALVLITLCLLGTSCSVQMTEDHVTNPPIDVLFVGNSYTYYNDMPEMVEKIAAANDSPIETTMLATGGYFLHDHVADGETAAALATGDFDVVVFQEQSLAPAIDLANSRTAAASLVSLAESADVRVIFYQTWGREQGAPNFGFSSYTEMQEALVVGYDQMARWTGSEVARVGESWQRLRRSGASINLYDADGAHPSPAGSYASAAEITETILEMEIVVLPAVGDVDLETAAVVAAFG